MARIGKKKTELNPEEKEEQFVPEEEQPYKVPSNWCWTRILACCEDLFSGKSPKYSKEPTEHLIIGQQANQRYGIDMSYVKYGAKDFALSQDERMFLRYNDVILNTLGTGSIGRSGIYKLNHKVLTDGHLFVFRTGSRYLPDLLYYYLQLNEEPIIDTANGSTNQKFLSLNSFSGYAIPLPPFAEQRRIVDRVESLFAKLDEAKEKAQAVVDGFEDRKAAILHQAFTGVLTEKWREENGISDDSRYSLPISEVCRSLKYGTAKKSQDSGKVVVIRMGNLQAGEIDWSDLAFSDDEEDIKKYRLDPGDVLFNRTNSAALVGKTSIYRGDYPAIYAGYLIKLDYNHEIMDGEYLNYILNSPEAKTYCNSVKTDGVNQSNINAKKIGAFVIPVPTMAEQLAIVKTLSSILTKEKATKEIAEKTIEKIREMKKAILTKAFRGELGTNDPSDESAEELLKRILQEDV